jgi:hypothetical protein
MSIRDQLKDFDGKHGDVIERILAEYNSSKSPINELVLLIADDEENIQIGATWLLKRLAETGARFKPKQLIALFDLLPGLDNWVTKLHVCQMLQYVEIPDESKKKVAWFLEQNLLGKNKFVKAWSYNGFYELAKQHREYYDTAIEHLERAEAEKAASIKARLRSIRTAMSQIQ